MSKTRQTVVALVADRRGVTAVEYAVIAGVVVLTVAAAFNVLGTTLLNFMSSLSL